MQITSVLAVLALGAAVGAVMAWLFMRAKVHAAFERG
jgi:hypothetical protein